MSNTTAIKGFDEQKIADLKTAVDKVVELGASGIQFRVANGDVVHNVTGGTAELGKAIPVPTDGRFRIACVTKVFVATVVLQLSTEGLIDLDETVEHYLPKLLPYGDKISIRNLLNHTGGLYNHADSFQRPGDRFLRDRYRHFDATELVAVAAKEPLNFEPGTTYEYSNTNYIVLGLLINAITGRSYAEEIRQRIIEPLALKNTFLPGEDPKIPGPHARGYMQIKGRSEDVTEMSPTEAGSAGEIISTNEDLDRFLVSLVTGKLLEPAAFEEMTTTVPPEWVPLPMSNGYGLGFMPMETRRGMSLWGHGGGLPGYATFIGSTLDGQKRLMVSISLNIDPDDFSGVFEDSVVDAINAAADCL